MRRSFVLSYPCFAANDTYGSTFELPILRPKMQVITFPPAHQGPIFPLNHATVTMSLLLTTATVVLAIPAIVAEQL